MMAGTGIIDQPGLARALRLISVALAAAAVLTLAHDLVDAARLDFADWRVRALFASGGGVTTGIACLGVLLAVIGASRLMPEGASAPRIVVRIVIAVALVTLVIVTAAVIAVLTHFGDEGGVSVASEWAGRFSMLLIEAAAMVLLASAIVIAWPYATKREP